MFRGFHYKHSIALLFCAFAFSGCLQPTIAGKKSATTTNNSTNTGGSTTGTTLTILTPLSGAVISQTNVGTNNSATVFNFSGDCSSSGSSTITISWSVAGVTAGSTTTTCVAGSYTKNIDLCAVADAPVTGLPIVATVSQSGQTSVNVNLYKYSTFCAANAATSLASGTMGSGTALDPYLICSMTQMLEVTNYLTANANVPYFQVVDNINDVAGTRAAIVRNGQTSVDTELHWDGGHTVYVGSTIDASLSGSNHAGIFAELSAANSVITNWHIKNITITNDTVAGIEGGLVGYVNNTATISYITATNITLTESALETAGKPYTYGKGGVIGAVGDFTVTLDHIDVIGGSITGISADASASGFGGIVGTAGITA